MKWAVSPSASTHLSASTDSLSDVDTDSRGAQLLVEEGRGRPLDEEAVPFVDSEEQQPKTGMVVVTYGLVLLLALLALRWRASEPIHHWWRSAVALSLVAPPGSLRQQAEAGAALVVPLGRLAPVAVMVLALIAQGEALPDLLTSPWLALALLSLVEWQSPVPNSINVLWQVAERCLWRLLPAVLEVAVLAEDVPHEPWQAVWWAASLATWLALTLSVAGAEVVEALLQEEVLTVEARCRVLVAQSVLVTGSAGAGATTVMLAAMARTLVPLPHEWRSVCQEATRERVEWKECLGCLGDPRGREYLCYFFMLTNPAYWFQSRCLGNIQWLATATHLWQLSVALHLLFPGWHFWHMLLLLLEQHMSVILSFDTVTVMTHPTIPEALLLFVGAIFALLAVPWSAVLELTWDDPELWAFLLAATMVIAFVRMAVFLDVLPVCLQNVRDSVGCFRGCLRIASVDLKAVRSSVPQAVAVAAPAGLPDTTERPVAAMAAPASCSDNASSSSPPESSGSPPDTISSDASTAASIGDLTWRERLKRLKGKAWRPLQKLVMIPEGRETAPEEGGEAAEEGHKDEGRGLGGIAQGSAYRSVVMEEWNSGRHGQATEPGFVLSARLLAEQLERAKTPGHAGAADARALRGAVQVLESFAWEEVDRLRLRLRRVGGELMRLGDIAAAQGALELLLLDSVGRKKQRPGVRIVLELVEEGPAPPESVASAGLLERAGRSPEEQAQLSTLALLGAAMAAPDLADYELGEERARLRRRDGQAMQDLELMAARGYLEDLLKERLSHRQVWLELHDVREPVPDTPPCSPRHGWAAAQAEPAAHVGWWQAATAAMPWHRQLVAVPQPR